MAESLGGLALRDRQRPQRAGRCRCRRSRCRAVSGAPAGSVAAAGRAWHPCGMACRDGGRECDFFRDLACAALRRPPAGAMEPLAAKPCRYAPSAAIASATLVAYAGRGERPPRDGAASLAGRRCWNTPTYAPGSVADFRSRPGGRPVLRLPPASVFPAGRFRSFSLDLGGNAPWAYAVCRQC